MMIPRLVVGALALALHTHAALAADKAPTAPPSPIRIEIPDNVDPMIYIFTQAGSVGLAKGYAESARSIYTTETQLTAREREALRAVAMLLEKNSRITSSPKLEYTDEVIPVEFYENLQNYKSWSGYSARERLAIELITRFLTEHRKITTDEQFWTAMHANFSSNEIMDLVYMCGSLGMIHSINSVLGLNSDFLQAAAVRNSGGSGGGERTVGLVTKRILDEVERRKAEQTRSNQK
jgi:hypothetical protein